MTIRVAYHNGVFVPDGQCEIPEGAEGLVLVPSAGLEPAPVTDPEERRRLLHELVASLRNNPLPPDSPKLTRDQLHERN